MKRNKHILLFEAFAANTLSKTILFLDKEVGKKQRVEFLNNFKSFLEKYDVPLDKIDDSCFDYLGKKDALELRSTEPVENSEGVFCFKFWFSTDKGFLGYTYTGNVTKKEEVRRKRPSDKVTFEDIESVGIKSGTFKSLNDLSGLKTGDQIYGIFSGNPNDTFIPAIVFVEDDEVFAIQDHSSGSEPNCSPDRWRRYGRLSWALGRIYNSRSSDNYKLCLYINDGKELNINGVLKDKKIEPAKPITNPLEFNLPMVNKLPRSWWSDSFNSISEESLKKADFAVILYYDKLVSLGLQKPSELKAKREENRKDAYALLKNEEIKRENINRYMDKICDGLGLNYENELNPRNLQKLLSKMINGNLSIMYIGWRDIPNRLQRLIGDIYYLVEEYNEASKPLTERQKERLQDRYYQVTSRIKDYYNDRNLKGDRERLNKLIEKLKENNKEEEIKIIERVLSIGEYISKSISSSSMNSLDDLRMAELKISSIRNIINNDYMKLTSQVRNCFDSIRHDIGDAYYYITEVKNNEGYDKANARIDLLERYVKSITF